jgi:hypothetical protein
MPSSPLGNRTSWLCRAWFKKRDVVRKAPRRNVLQGASIIQMPCSDVCQFQLSPGVLCQGSGNPN